MKGGMTEWKLVDQEGMSGFWGFRKQDEGRNRRKDVPKKDRKKRGCVRKKLRQNKMWQGIKILKTLVRLFYERCVLSICAKKKVVSGRKQIPKQFR